MGESPAPQRVGTLSGNKKPPIAGGREVKQVRENLKSARKAKCMTQQAVADYLGITLRHYQKIEYGKINLSALQLMELADFFGVTTDYLLGRD